MYRFAARITPAQIEAIAAQLFVECLRHGYTSLCEFHYLHRGPDGAAYARPAETAERIAAAGHTTGMGLTLLPVLYSHAGFGEQPLRQEQRRFRSGVDDVDTLVAMLVQSERFGTSVGDSLRVYSENLRGKRRMVAEECAAKIGLKLLFPLIFCIFPTLMMVLLAPAAIQIWRVLGT